MAEVERAKLNAFEATLRPGTKMRWPGGATLAPDDTVTFEPGPGDLLLLSYAPSRRFLGREPTHESLMIELRDTLADALPGPLRMGPVVYRAGTERLAYQATRAMGTIALVEATPKAFAIELMLTLIAPELDTDHAGSHKLAGIVRVPRR